MGRAPMTGERRILLIGCLAGGTVALFLGFTLEWDLLNYHLYNPHALLHGRHAIDLAPAQMQTFLNPALHVPLYLLFTYWHSAAAVFVTGAVQGSQLLLLYLVLAELVDRERFPAWMLLTVAALGLGGPVFLNQLGSGQGDTLLSLPVLAALLAILRERKDPQSRRALRVGIVSGALLGLATALKLTMAVYAVALTATAFILFTGSGRWKILSGLALGGVLGAALGGGPWFAWLWWTWESPLFPYFNEVFQSSWVNSADYRDLRFLPRNPVEWVFYPWVWLFDSLRVWEFRFRDLRIPLLFALALLVPILGARWLRERRPELLLIWVFVAVSYVLWLRLFSIYRYLAVVEMLAPLLIFATAVSIMRSRRAALAVLAFLLISQLAVKFDRQPSTWLFQADAETAAADLPPDAMVIIDGFEPVAYTALWLDDAIPLVRIRANFMHTDEPGHRLQERAHGLVRNHPGPRYLLLPREDQAAPFIDSDLERLGLTLDDRSVCQPFFRNDELQRLLGSRICPLAAHPQAGGAGR